MFRRVLVVSWFSITCSAARSPGIEHSPSHQTRVNGPTADAAPREPALAPEPVNDTSLYASTRVAAGNALGIPANRNDTRTCPSEMSLIEGASGPFCIDRWEASLERKLSSRKREAWPANAPIDGREKEMVAVSRPGVTPQGYISGAQASRACKNAGKRLCRLREWQTACQGPRETKFPYGNKRRARACNDRTLTKTPHPVIRAFRKFAPRGTDRKSMWGLAAMNDPRLFELEDTIAATGENADCSNEYGVYDQVGNLHEWIDDPRGTFVGGYFMDTVKNGDGCLYKTTAHNVNYHDYSTGFRCCADASSF